MKNALNSVKISSPQRNTFDLSHEVKMSGNMGNLMPCFVTECIPGDSWSLGCENLIRLAPMLAPLMHKVDVRVEYFFCPERLVWNNFKTWITNGGDNPDPESPLPARPYFYYGKATPPEPSNFINYTKLMDYMGLPDPDQCPNPGLREKVVAAPFACYQFIWDEYYRDQNLIDKVFPEESKLEDGNNTVLLGPDILTTMRKRAWEADYFTKALPDAQKGEPVDLPIGEITLRSDWDDDSTPVFQLNSGGYANGFVKQINDTPSYIGLESDGYSGKNAYDPDGSLVASAATINDLRLAFRLQEWLEKNARGGTRYAEIIRAHFNVRPQDARLQRPEYIVGVKNPIQVSEVLNTTGTEDAPQGSMAGHGISYNSGNYGKYFCPEHGWIIGIFSVMPKTAYQQGIPKHYLKFTDPTELAWPTFGNLGEQPILNKEIMAFRDPGEGELTFGYTPRYMEYKTMPDRVAGDFRTSLNFWHMGRIFDPLTPPVLNEDFVSADPTERIFAVEDPEVEIDHVWALIKHHVYVKRALPFYGTPSF